MPADPNAKAIVKAAKSGDVATVRQLLAEDASLIDARDRDGSTPLHCTAWKGHAKVARTLIEAGANINATNENTHWGSTPLHAAAHGNNAAVAQLLLDNGADIDAADRDGRTPIFHTTFHKATAVAKLLRERGATE